MDNFSSRLHKIVVILSDCSTIVLQLHFLALFVINVTKTPRSSASLRRMYKLFEIFAGLMTPLAKR
jgi:hypothetical protein